MYDDLGGMWKSKIIPTLSEFDEENHGTHRQSSRLQIIDSKPGPFDCESGVLSAHAWHAVGF